MKTRPAYAFCGGESCGKRAGRVKDGKGERFMFQWIADNIWALFVILVLAGIIAAAVYTVVRDKRKGKASCGCNCAHCAMAGSCHNAEKAQSSGHDRSASPDAHNKE